ELVSQDGLPVPSIRGEGVGLGQYDCECRKAVASGRPVVVEDIRQNVACAGLFADKRARTCATVPVKSKGRTIGAIFVARQRENPFAREEVELIAAIGLQVGTVLENAQLLSKAEALAVLQERERVAREVHDGLAQTLGYLNVQMGIVGRLLASEELPKAREELEEMTRVTREAYQDLRQAIVDLRAPLPSTGGLRRTLREYAERFSHQTGILCHFEGHRGLPAILPPTAEVQLIRIVQEALTNVRKHAPGSEVWLSVEASERAVRVAIKDDGPGFDVEAALRGSQLGLKTMKERAQSIGGALRIDSRPGVGTTLEVTVPLETGRRR
ncbi:MAG TPA: GAF domain-containing sensor histidine kinase, partial [Dehalococcoidia bacterium]|nr:GAF domain-containing sensor histidine kinase [Dehalococcoidia bacterium]